MNMPLCRCFCFMILLCGVAQANPLFSANKMMLVDGKPRFIVGLYENVKEDVLLKEVAESGFDLVNCPPERAALDRVAKFGLKAWVNLGGNLDLSVDTEARKAALAKIVDELKDHPALLLWEGPDEVLWNIWYGERQQYFEEKEFPALIAAGKEAGKSADVEALLDAYHRGLWSAFDAKRNEVWAMLGKTSPNPAVKMATWLEDVKRVGEGIKAGIEYVKSIDPKHPVWLNHAPRNSLKSLSYFNRAADIAGCDIYPVPQDQGHSDFYAPFPPAVGAYTRRMREAAPGKSCAMVLQGFGWRDLFEKMRNEKPAAFGRRPSFQETRFMAYDAIVNGANMVLYWGTSTIEKDSLLWKDLMVVARELKALQPALAAPDQKTLDVVLEETGGSLDGKGILTLLKKVEDDYVLIVVNETQFPAVFTITGLPKALDGRLLYPVGGPFGQTFGVEKGSFQYGLRPFDVGVYATSKRFDVKK